MRNRRTVLVYLAALCGALSLLFFKSGGTYTDLTFSRESGFYDTEFKLKLYAPPGTEIYYTLDGSLPDENSIKYVEPIVITDATENDNVYSLRTDTSAGYFTEEIDRYGCAGQPPGYIVPDYHIDKCTIVRAVYFDADGKPGEIKTESFFVGYDNKRGYDGISIISIVTDPENLFHQDEGIYTVGNIYYEYMEENRESVDAHWEWWGANYHQRGYEWERAADIQLFDTERKLVLNQGCGIRIKGGVSRGLFPKSINLFAREQYDTNERFYADLFRTHYVADTVTLFSGGQDAVSKLRDRLTAELVKDRNLVTMNFVPYIMFLDGEYWGIYWLTEKYDDVYLAHYYNVDKDNVIMIKSGSGVEEGKKEDDEIYMQMIEYMINTDLSIPENYQYACELIDIQSFIDYFATEIYIARNGDWPSVNFALWRTRENGEGSYEDGKWRWMLFDVYSASLSTEWLEHDTLHYAMEADKMFYNLCQNDDFRKQFVISFMDMANTSFSKEKITGIIADYLDLMADPMEVYSKRIYGLDDNSRFLEDVADIQSFFDKRKQYIVQYLKSDLALMGKLVPVKVEVNDVDGGHVVVNTAEVTFDDKAEWRGEYYTDYPLTVTAVPHEGYRFVCWEKDTSSLERSIQINPAEEGISLRAIFEKTD